MCYHVAMSILVAIILGLVQGLTEFIPVSSSGHLVIANAVLNTSQSASDIFIFSVLLNIGTLVALVVYYRQKIAAIIFDVVLRRQLRLVGKLLLATVPAIVAGLFLEQLFTTMDTEVLPVAIMLIVLGIVFVVAGKPSPHPAKTSLEAIPLATFLWVGCMQALALLPGTSRSGITILTGLRRNLSAERAAELSFLLAIPTIAGASLKVLLGAEGRAFIVAEWPAILAGNIVSFISGYIAIRFLISLVNRRGLAPFGWYRIALAAVLLLLVSVKIL